MIRGRIGVIFNGIDFPKGEECKAISSFTTKIGGTTHEIKNACMIDAEIEGLPFDIKAYPIDDIGNADGNELDMIVGATAMEEWGIIPNPKKKELDLSILEKREFTEFMNLL